MQVIDFFCGCGGASEGFRQAGFEVLLGLDNDTSASQTYKLNFPNALFIPKDITGVPTSQVMELLKGKLKKPLLFTACAPCQPFSSQNKLKSSRDSRFSLLNETHRFIKLLKPDYIVIENVPGIQTVDKQTNGPFGQFLGLLNELHYSFEYSVTQAQNYGVPQKRKRLVLVATKHGKIVFPPHTHGEDGRPFVTVRDTIGHLPLLQHGEVDPSDPLHKAAKMEPKNLERIKHTPEGGDRRDWPAHLINPAHQGYKGHTDTYGRMKWDALAPTLTTKCHSYSNGRFGHPDITQNRALSLREASLLQTFPRNYRFHGATGEIAKQIGNAVPCELARVFGLYIKKHYKTLSCNQD